MTKAEEKQTKVVGKIEPQTVDRLGNNEEWIFTDANGYDWKYTFQFPGVMKAYEMLDNARMANGMIAKSILYNEYLQNIVVSEKLELDDMNDRPGLEELFEAMDLFLGERIS